MLFSTNFLFFLLTTRGNATAQKVTLKNSSESQSLQMLNSEADESNLFYDEANRKLYFVRRYHPENTGGKNDPGDIWFAKKKDDGSWSVPYKLGRLLNDADENLLFGISNAGTVLWLYGKYDDESLIKRKSHLFRHRLGSNLFERQKIKYYHNVSKTPTFFVNNEADIMILSINTFDSKGVEDLYVSFIEPKESKYHWSIPKNLGVGVNTKNQESSPFLSNDNISLFFSSNGHKGKGSKDIFLTQRTSIDWSSWSKPHNLKDNINTKGTEEYFIFPEKGVGYFTSTFDSYGYGDIKTVKWVNANKLKVNNQNLVSSMYESANQSRLDAVSVPDTIASTSSINHKEKITQKSPPILLKGEVFEKDTHNTLQATITVTPRDTKGRETDFVVECVSSINGKYQLNLALHEEVKPPMELSIRVKAKNYFPLLQVIEYEGSPLKMNFKLEKLEKNATINLQNVLFTAGTSKLLDESLNQLDLIIEEMLENKKMKIELRGHTDGADNDSNRILSQKRVNTIKNILLKKGIEKGRIKGLGFGSSLPLFNNEDQENRQKNRRVEFKVLDI